MSTKTRVEVGRRWNWWLAWQVLRGRVISIEASWSYSNDQIVVRLQGGQIR